MSVPSEQKTLSARFFGVFVLVLFVGLLPIGGSASDASDYDGSADPTMKEQWQGEYRRLLQDAARLQRNAETARENYSQAQQRNYPRGAARQRLLVDEDEARKGLAAVEAEIEKFKLEGRHAGILPGWYYEVEEEPVAAAPEPTASRDEDPEDREGRNPLYLDQD